MAFNDSRLVLDRVRLELLQTAKRALLELAVVYNMIGLLGNHALNEIDCVVENNSESLCSICACLHRLDLYTLHDGIDHILATKHLSEAAM